MATGSYSWGGGLLTGTAPGAKGEPWGPGSRQLAVWGVSSVVTISSTGGVRNHVLFKSGSWHGNLAPSGVASYEVPSLVFLEHLHHADLCARRRTRGLQTRRESCVRGPYTSVNRCHKWAIVKTHEDDGEKNLG